MAAEQWRVFVTFADDCPVCGRRPSRIAKVDGPLQTVVSATRNPDQRLRYLASVVCEQGHRWSCSAERKD